MLDMSLRGLYRYIQNDTNILFLKNMHDQERSGPLPEKFLLILFTNYEHLNVQTCLLPCLCLNYKS